MFQAKIFTSVALASVMGVLALPALAQSGNPVNILTRSLDNMPREKGAAMANGMAERNAFEMQSAKDKAAGEGADAAPEQTPPAGQVAVAPDGSAAVPASEVASGEAQATPWPAGPKADPAPEAINVPAGEPRVAPAEGAVTGRSYDEDADPITQHAIQVLDETGVLGRQRQLAESIIMMDQRLRYNRKVEELLTALGPDAEIEVAPGVYKTFEDTPAGIKARISYIELQKQLAEAMGAGTTGDSNSGAGQAAEDASAEEGRGLPVRDDGTGYQQMGGGSVAGEATEAAASGSEDRLERMLADAEARLARQEARIDRMTRENAEKEKDAPVGVEAISLREIYGAVNTYIAVIEVGGLREELRVGDEVAGGYTVTAIQATFMDLEKNGESTRISL